MSYKNTISIILMGDNCQNNTILLYNFRVQSYGEDGAVRNILGFGSWFGEETLA